MVTKIILWIAFAICILLSGFFACSETVYSSVNQLRLRKDVEKSKVTAIALKNAEDFDKTNSAILLGTNLAHIAASTIGAILCELYFGTGTIADLVSTFGTFVILLILGEILPKVIGLSNSYKLSKAFAVVIKILKIICFPITWPVTKLATLIFKVRKVQEEKNDDDDEEETVSDDELIEMVEAIEDEGFIDDSQVELLKNAIDFTDCSAMQIMTPRVDVFGFDIEDDLSSLTTDSEIFQHSRIPVYEENLDNIIGILRTTDVLKKINNGEKNIDIRSLMYEPYYVPESKQISSILDDFKENHYHIAIVKDEYGGTAGILTIEDIEEELVGDIWDEMDDVEEDYKKKNDNEFIALGSMNLEDFFELVGLDFDEYDGESATVNGWVTENLDEFPKVGDTFEYKDLKVEILKTEEFTAEEIKVTRLEEKKNDEE